MGTGIRARRLSLAAAAVALAVLAAVAWFWRPHAVTRSSDGRARAPAPPDAPIAAEFHSPYRNTAPNVRYVGDSTCVDCHREISEQYAQHPMGRSLAIAAADASRLPSVPPSGVAFDANGFRYEVVREGDRLVHRETRRDASGAVVAEIACEVGHALGSGTRGVAYLYERDGYVFQSPISWYSQEGRWDLAPGYAVSDNPHFNRPVDAGCLFCHANQVVPKAGRVNAYEPPVFRGLAIGCERCHGPGELHVQAHQSGGDVDWTIVNPARLDPKLRDAVCQQCHLMGETRATRAGRSEFDYRPGLPLSDILAVHERALGAHGEFDAVGHAEQMVASRCFQASAGAMGCITCHDPHRALAAEEAPAYFNKRCASCHESRPCTVEPAVLAQNQADCVKCHMPKKALGNIPHTAATDHRIPRNRREKPTPNDPSRTGSDDKSLLLSFFSVNYRKEDEDRDFGIALVQAAKGGTPRLDRAGAIARALPLLDDATARRPKDGPSWRARGDALRLTGRLKEALASYEKASIPQYDDESAILGAGSVAAQLGNWDAARRHYQHLVELSPLRADYHAALAESAARKSDWETALDSCRRALELNPALVPARSLLMRILMFQGHEAAARRELGVLKALAPASSPMWEEWFREQVEQRSRARDTDRHP